MTNTNKKAAVILAAGKGKRMKSDLPKVLHPIAGKPMIVILIDVLIKLKFDRIVVVIGHEGEQVKKALADYPVEFAWQKEQLGTGHAVQMTADLLSEFDGTTLIALGDVPFLSADSISRLFEVHAQAKAAATCLSAILTDPTGYGRIVREPGTDLLMDIVEHKDASEEIRKINEINSGTFCYDNLAMFSALDKLENNNSQGEFYLTDTVKILRDKGLPVAVVATDNPDELRGVNSVEQLQELADLFADRLK